MTDFTSGSDTTGLFNLPPGLLDPSLSGYANSQTLMGLAQGLMKAGAPSFTPKSIGSIASDAGTGLLSGAQNGLNNSMQLQNILMQRQGIGATYQALLAKGIPEPAARAAAMNPELLKTMAPALYQTPQIIDGGTDPLTGQKNNQLYNPNNGTVSPLTPGAPVNTSPLPASIGNAATVAAGAANGSPQSGQQPNQGTPLPSAVLGADGKPDTSVAPFAQAIGTTQNLGTLQAAISKGVTGQALYQYMPPSLRPLVQSMVEGNQPVPSSMAMRSPAVLAAIGAAHAIDPTFNGGQTWNARNKMRSDYASNTASSAGGQITAGNTALTHLADLSDLFKQLKALPYEASGVTNAGGLANRVVNAANEGTGSDRANLVNQIDSIRGLYVDERSKFYKGVGATDADSKAGEELFSADKSPAELQSAAETEAKAIRDKISSLQGQWRDVMGKTAGDYPIMKPNGLSALTRLNGNSTAILGKSGILPFGPVSGDQPQAQPGNGQPSPYAPIIRTIETGSPQGNYNSVVDAGNGHKVYGAYQVEDANIGPWTKQWYGQALTPAQFLKNPQAQDAVFNGQHSQYVQKYGPIGAAMAWHGGEGALKNPMAADRFGTTNLAYAAKFARLTGQPLVITNPKTGARMAWQNGNWAPVSTETANAQ